MTTVLLVELTKMVGGKGLPDTAALVSVQRMLAIFQPVSAVGTATVSVVATLSAVRVWVAPVVTVFSTVLLFFCFASQC